MSSIFKSINASVPAQHLRAFDAGRDMIAVADLVELCFAETLDVDGQRYLNQMRSVARSPGFMRWATAVGDWASIPISGFVWEEDGRIVGNLNLMPYFLHGQQRFLIANVAVHPDYRRRGIARSLTARAIDAANHRGAGSVWLHVREDNPAAVSLYRSLGFVERARRDTWYSEKSSPQAADDVGWTFGALSPHHWGQVSSWLKRVYPGELTWHLPMDLFAMRPGILGLVYRILMDKDVRQWGVFQNGDLVGALYIQISNTQASPIWLATSTQIDDSLIGAMLRFVRRKLPARQLLMLDYPAHQARSVITDVGFQLHQTLIWMNVVFANRP
jgi:ribosomal protein S18 acetylase RimI-like enzyme